MPNVQDTPQKIVGNTSQTTAVFDPSVSGGQVSSNIYSAGNTFIALQLPSSFVAGNLSFFSSVTGLPGSYYQLTDTAGSPVLIPTTATGTIITPPASTILGTVAGIEITLDPAIFCGVQNLIIYCSNAQVAIKNVILIIAPVLGS